MAKGQRFEKKVIFLERIPESAINRAVQTLLDLRETCENSTKEERIDLVYVMNQEVGVEVATKRVRWVKARPRFDVLFQLLNNLRVDEQRRFWIAYPDVNMYVCDIREDLTQMSKSPSRCPTMPSIAK